jgi:phosphatidylglycerol:prolipoprotein diacylglycerol transferase
MHQILIDAGWFQIRSYGFMLAISFLAGIYLASRRARQKGIEPQTILDLSVMIIVAAVVGSRALYVVYHLEDYSNPLQFFALWEGGATFYGGLILAVVVSYAFAYRKKLVFLQVADIIAPSIALGMALTRIGCFLSGCCYGKPTGLPWGVDFPDACPAGESAAEAALKLGVDTVLLHPTQMYSFLYGMVIFVVLLAAEKKIRKTGALFGMLVLLAGVARFVVDFFRFYEENARTVLGLSFSQVIAVGMVLLGLFLMNRKAPEPVRSKGG